MSYWLTIRTPGEVHCWYLGNPSDDEREQLVHRARLVVGFPADDAWVADVSLGYAVQIEPGGTEGDQRPFAVHKGRATVRDVAELAAVKPAAVDAYQAQRIAYHRTVEIDSAKAVLDRLAPDVKSEVLSAYGQVVASAATKRT